MNTSKWSLIASGCAAVLIGCFDDHAADPGVGSAALKPAPNKVTRVASFPMSWAPPAGFSPADAAFRMASVMVGDNAGLSAARFAEKGGEFTSTGKRWVGDKTWDDRVGDLAVKYYPRFNDLRLSNERLQTIADGPDIGEDAAREQFKAALAKLAQRGVIRMSDYDLGAVKVSKTVFGSAPAGEEATPVVIEYVFGLLKHLNGVSVANAGVKIAVHRSGEISAIRLGGVSVAAKAPAASEVGIGLAEMPAAGGRVFDVTVAREHAQARFAREFPRGRKVWDEMMYVMPDEQDSTVVHPRHVVSYSNRYVSDEGEVVSRRKMAGYSVVDALAQAEDIGEKAKPNDVGDRR